MALKTRYFFTGLTSTSVRGCCSNEDVRTSKNKCQPTHLPVEQEILRQIDSYQRIKFSP